MSLYDKGLAILGLQRARPNAGELTGYSNYGGYSWLNSDYFNQVDEVVYACVRTLADQVSSTSLQLYTKDKQRATSHPLYRILHDSPNAEQTISQFLSHATWALCLTGNHYSLITRGTRGEVVSITPFPDQSIIKPVRYKGVKYFIDTKTQYVYYQHEVLHLMEHATENGLYGVSPIERCAQTIAASKVSTSFFTNFLNNAAFAGGVLEMDPALQKADESTRKQLRESFEAHHVGGRKQGRVAVLPPGVKFIPATLNIKDLQFIETKRFTAERIASLFGLSPVQIGDMSNNSYSSYEQQAASFTNSTLRPRLVTLEQSLQKTLLLDSEKDHYKVEFLIDSISRADLNARREYYQSAMLTGWLTANEVRAAENREALPGGDVLLRPLNQGEAAQTGTGDTRSLQISSSKLDGAAGLIDTSEDSEAANTRSLRYANKRALVTDASIDSIADALQRVVRRERSDVLRMFTSTPDVQVLVQRLKEFYKNSHRDFYESATSPALRTLARSVLLELREELENAPDFDADVWLDEFAKELATRHIQRRLTETLQIVEDEELEDRETALRDNFDGELEQTGIEGQDTAYNTSNALTRAMYVAAGATLLRWLNNDSACNICKRLHNRVVGVEQPFVSAGEVISPEFTAKRSSLHPPLHKGCACRIARS